MCLSLNLTSPHRSLFPAPAAFTPFHSFLFASSFIVPDVSLSLCSLLSGSPRFTLWPFPIAQIVCTPHARSRHARSRHPHVYQRPPTTSRFPTSPPRARICFPRYQLRPAEIRTQHRECVCIPPAALYYPATCHLHLPRLRSYVYHRLLDSQTDGWTSAPPSFALIAASGARARRTSRYRAAPFRRCRSFEPIPPHTRCRVSQGCTPASGSLILHTDMVTSRRGLPHSTAHLPSCRLPPNAET